MGPSREEGTLQEGRAESGVGCQHGAGSAGRIPAGVGTPQAPAGQDEGGGHRTLDRWVASYHHISPTATHLEAGTGDAPAGHSQARAGASRAGERRGAVQRRGREEVAAWRSATGAGTTDSTRGVKGTGEARLGETGEVACVSTFRGEVGRRQGRGAGRWPPEPAAKAGLAGGDGAVIGASAFPVETTRGGAVPAGHGRPGRQVQASRGT